MLIMLDVVPNHMGNMLDSQVVLNVPFNKLEHYHQQCEITQQDYQTRNQWRI